MRGACVLDSTSDHDVTIQTAGRAACGFPGARGVKRILLAHPRLAGQPGGAEAVAAWLIQGLLERSDLRLDLACATAPDFAALDSHFGTRLEASGAGARVHVLPWPVQFAVGAVRATGLRGAALEMSLLEQHVRTIAREHGPYDLFISTNNELVFPSGARNLAYIHYPRYHPERGRTELRWYHHIPGVLPLYNLLCRRINGFSAARLGSTVAIANSGWTAERYRSVHGRVPDVVNPPVPCVDETAVPWDARENAIVILGRLAPEKRILESVDVIDRVRRRVGPALAPTLHVIGNWDHQRSYNERLRRAFAEKASWIRHTANLSRVALDAAIASSRYGFHRMDDEHFGMAVAELQRSGCVAFVPSTGGPREIVGEEPRQIFATDDEAVDRLAAVLRDPALQRGLHERALERRALFSTRRFIGEMLANVDALLSPPADVPAGVRS